MRTVVWTHEAKNDLLNIISFYNKRNGNSKYSKKIVSAIKKSLFFLESNPFLGISVEHMIDYRVIIIKEYKIFYKIRSDSIEIKLIWDNRQNPDTIPDR